MYNRLYEFVIKNEILYEKQFGFQAAHSAAHAILELVHRISKFENGNFTIGILVDLSKVFDATDHTILLNKLNQYGI